MNFDHSSGFSPRVCMRCKQLKRKCDKALPKCHSCAKSHFICLYQGLPESHAKDDATSSAAPPVKKSNTALRSSMSGLDSASSDFPPTYFLDWRLYQRTVSEIPRTTTATLPGLQALTEDIREQAKIYFRSVHPWFPFLSPKIFNERLLSPLTPRSTDLSLLLACIKLICQRPEGENGRTTEYVIIKESLLQAEIAGIFTIRVLQACILLCLYEIGHAIYPSAYLSIGTCARYAAALGIRNDKDAPDQNRHCMEAEEKTRAWWAIVILDRFSNLGWPRPSLSTEDPNNDTKLPIDDALWNQGILKYDQVATLSTPPTPLMGRYGLMAQAASLLGRVLHHLNNTENDSPFYIEEATILDRTLTALTLVANEEGSTRGIGVCTPTVICHSARISLALCERSHEKFVENFHSDQSNFVLQSGIASDMTKLSRWVTSERGPTIDDEMSLFPLDAAYRTAAAYIEMYSKNPNEEYLHGIKQVKALLIWYNQRWKLAGTYLKLIQARESIWM